MNSPLNKQVAGSHYKKLAIQPVEFCMANHYDSCASSIVKYILRHEHKNGREDVEKAIHFAELRMELTFGVNQIERMASWLRAELGTQRFRKTNGFTIPMERLVEKNWVKGTEAAALLALESWLLTGDKVHYEAMLFAMRQIVDKYEADERGL